MTPSRISGNEVYWIECHQRRLAHNRSENLPRDEEINKRNLRQLQSLGSLSMVI
jgi:hypothetical protein